MTKNQSPISPLIVAKNLPLSLGRGRIGLSLAPFPLSRQKRFPDAQRLLASPALRMLKFQLGLSFGSAVCSAVGYAKFKTMVCLKVLLFCASRISCGHVASISSIFGLFLYFRSGIFSSTDAGSALLSTLCHR